MAGEVKAVCICSPKLAIRYCSNVDVLLANCKELNVINTRVSLLLL